MNFKKLVSLFVISVIFVGVAYSQTVPVQPKGAQEAPQNIEVSDSELETFIKVSGDLQMLQMNFQQKMGKIIQDNGMKMQRYQQIARGKQQGQEMELSKEEEKAYVSIQEKIKQESQGLKKEMQDVLAKYSMDQKRYMQVSKALRQDKELQNRFKKMQKKHQNAPKQ